jgi:hypothetical protein
MGKTLLHRLYHQEGHSFIESEPVPEPVPEPVAVPGTGGLHTQITSPISTEV